MAVFFFDTSALVKRYVDEPGSTWVRRICGARDADTNTPMNLGMVGSIAIVEIAAAISILERRDIIPKRVAERAYKRFIEDFENEYQITNVTLGLLSTAANLARLYPLKAYDAVQLELALAAKETLAQDGIELTFVSGDRQLLQAAQTEGPTIENPFTYAHLDNSASQPKLP